MGRARWLREERPPYLAVGILSAAALAYEVLLTRLFAIIQWHHFAYMMISVAMLGWGAAGTLVAILREPLQRRYRLAFTAAAALFGLSALACFLLAQAIAFNPDCPLGRAMMARRMASRFAHGRRAHSHTMGEEHGREDAARRPPGRAQAREVSRR